MKILKTIIVLLSITVALASCDSYLDVNDDVNNPTSDNVPPRLMLGPALNGSYIALTTRQNQFGNIMMNMWAGDVTNFTGGNTDEYHYNITSNFYSGIWDNMYVATGKMQDIINKDSEENAYFTAIAKIIKSHNMQYIVDIYGDSPYSEAFQRGENYQPTYDDAKDIYQSLYNDLVDAIGIIDNATSVALNPGGSDIILGGDMEMWKKFANTLRLKLLVRANSSSDATVQTWVNDKFADLNGVSFLEAGENIKINPGYVAEEGRQNPFWEYMGYKADGNPVQNQKFTIGSEYFIEYLKGSSAPFVFDDRITKLFNIADGSATYQGIEQGADDPDDPNIGLSHLGSGLLNSADQDGVFFTASESLFLQAEAALNGKISGDATQLLKDAITESFNLLDLNSSASAYIGSVVTGGATLQQIIEQKWIALSGFDGCETYIEHTRTGFPNPPLPLLTTDTHRPYRLMYPNSEFVGNASNVISITRASLFNPSLFYQQ